jgi:hypothetical protein
MLSTALGAFITANRDEVIQRCQSKVAARLNFVVTPVEMDYGIPLFVDQLIEELESKSTNTRAIMFAATEHGRALYSQGLTIGQVVHDYGDVCQSVTELVGELSSTVSAEEFRTLNRCLDDAIAAAVTEFARQEDATTDRHALGQSATLKNLLFTAIGGFEAIQTGTVGATGTTAGLVHRSLVAMRVQLDHPFTPVE